MTSVTALDLLMLLPLLLEAAAGCGLIVFGIIENPTLTDLGVRSPNVLWTV